MPSLGGPRRRYHGKQLPQAKKAAPPAPLSITSSNASEVGNASATSKEIFHSSLRPSKRLIPKTAGRPERSVPLNGQAKSMAILSRENVDVFAFMERDDSNESGTDASDDPASEASPPSSPRSLSNTPRMIDLPQKSPRYSDLEVRVQHPASRGWRQSSLHSDSGISVRSHSADEDSPSIKDKYPLDRETPRIGVADYEQGGDESGSNALQISPDFQTDTAAFSHHQWPSLDMGGPETYQGSSPQLSQEHVNVLDGKHALPTQTRSGNSLVQLERRRRRESRSAVQPSPKLGYDLLASQIDSRNDALLTPIYRKFEILNNRMLLYLQDEIAQMEEDLRELDSAIALEEADQGHTRPASRRLEAKMPSQLQWHRMDLMGRTFAKVEQYNRALTSYSNLAKSLEPASQVDVATYRQWITQHTPITEQETHFLNQEADLLAVTPPQNPTIITAPATTTTTAGAKDTNKKHLEAPAVVVAFALVATIIVFKTVPRILGRLLISAMVGVAALAILYPGAIMHMSSQRGSNLRAMGRDVAVYCGVMIVLSFVVA